MTMLTSAVTAYWNNLPAEDREKLFASLREARMRREEAARAYLDEQAQVIRDETRRILAQPPLAKSLQSGARLGDARQPHGETVQSGDACRDR